MILKKNVVYKTALTGILCAQAVVLGLLESYLPATPWLPPGAKPGFSNIITMFAADSLGLSYALLITVVKSGFVLATRGVTAALMSVSGGILSTLTMYFLLKYSKKLGLVGISVISALSHNAGQLITSLVITGSPKTVYYAPYLIVFGIITGILTGIIFRAVMPVLNKQKKFFIN